MRISVTIDPRDHSVPDPSGGKGVLRAVKVTTPDPDEGPGDVLVTQPDTHIVFTFKADASDKDDELEECLFTGFRYMSIERKDAGYEYGDWAAPANDLSEWQGERGKDISYTVDTARYLHTQEGVDEMTIIDRTNRDVVYIYLIEWKEGDKYYVTDPKIRNQPGGG